LPASGRTESSGSCSCSPEEGEELLRPPVAVAATEPAAAERAAEPAAESVAGKLTIGVADLGNILLIDHYEISPNETVENIMEQIFKRRGAEFPVERQKLIGKGGKQLNKKDTFVLAGIKNNDKLILVLRDE